MNVHHPPSPQLAPTLFLFALNPAVMVTLITVMTVTFISRHYEIL